MFNTSRHIQRDRFLLRLRNADYVELWDLLSGMGEAPRSQAKFYARKIITLLTGDCKVPPWRLGKTLHQVLIAAGVAAPQDPSTAEGTAANADKREQIEAAKEQLYDTCLWIGTRLSQTPAQIAEGTTPTDLERIFYEIQKRDLEKERAMISAVLSQHGGAEAVKNIQKAIREIDGKQQRKGSKVVELDEYREMQEQLKLIQERQRA